MPNIQLGVLDRLAGPEVNHTAVHERVVAVVDAEDDRLAHLPLRSILTPEGPEDSGRGRCIGGVVGEFEGNLVD